MKRLQIFLLCYNRPAQALEMIGTILNQSWKNFDLIVSDNSTHTPLNIKDLPSDSRIHYMRRTPSLPSHIHFAKVQSEATAEFYMLLHDDDLIVENCIERLVSLLDRHPSAAAACANAYFMYGDRKTTIPFNPALKKEQVFSSPIAFLNQYLRPDLGVCPFPGYIYRRHLAQIEKLGEQEAGKYSDATYLTRLTLHGPVIWSPEFVMHYRIHDGNDSNSISISNFKKLVVWAEKKIRIERAHASMRLGRTWYIFLKLREKRRTQKNQSRTAKLIVGAYIARHPLWALKFLLGKFLKALQKL